MIDRAEERRVARDPLTQRLNADLIECFARHAARDHQFRKQRDNPRERPASTGNHPPE